MNRLVVAGSLLYSRCCSSMVVLSADLFYTPPKPIGVCADCRQIIPVDVSKVPWVDLGKPAHEDIGNIEPEEVESLSINLSKDDNDVTICGVLLSAWRKILASEFPLKEEVLERIKQAYIFGNRMQRALEDYKVSSVRLTRKSREQVDKETLERLPYDIKKGE